MKNFTKVMIGVATVGLFAAASLTQVIVNAWGDNSGGRQMYTLEQINKDRVLDNNGGPGKIVMNSISDNPVAGNEKYFVGVKSASEMAQDGSKWHNDEINVKDGETYTIRLYVHNNSPWGEKAVATGVNARFSLPMTVGKEQTIVGYLKADNATPSTYWDEVTLKSDEDFYVEYVKDSANYYNNMGNFTLTNNIIAAPGATLQNDGW